VLVIYIAAVVKTFAFQEPAKFALGKCGFAIVFQTS
jgi:hypothetical protein